MAKLTRIRKLRERDNQPRVLNLSYIHELASPVVIQRTFNTQHPTFRGPKSIRPPFVVVV